MSDILIVNRYGVFHEVPERLLPTIQRQGGRLATAEEAEAYTAGEGGIDAPAEVNAEERAAIAAPWADYDDLNAEQIAARLKTLPPEQVRLVLVYEAAHKARKTILDVAPPSEA